MKVKGKEQKVKIEQLRCGKNHCIALLNIGYIMEWGDNEYGQMGNRKRSGNLTPIVLKDFAGKKIKGVFAGDNKSGVIIEQE
jgi:alpha-tubulin suppressor-like RCC1 family protein